MIRNEVYRNLKFFSKQFPVSCLKSDWNPSTMRSVFSYSKFRPFLVSLVASSRKLSFWKIKVLSKLNSCHIFEKFFHTIRSLGRSLEQIPFMHCLICSTVTIILFSSSGHQANESIYRRFSMCQ